MNDFPKVTQQKVAELGQHQPLPHLLCPHPPLSRSTFITTHFILSLSNFPMSFTRNLISPSFILYKVSSTTPAWVLMQKMREREGGMTVWGTHCRPVTSFQCLLRAALLSTCRTPHGDCTGVPSFSLPPYSAAPLSALGPLPGADGEEETSRFPGSLHLAGAGWSGNAIGGGKGAEPHI